MLHHFIVSLLASSAMWGSVGCRASKRGLWEDKTAAPRFHGSTTCHSASRHRWGAQPGTATSHSPQPGVERLLRGSAASPQRLPGQGWRDLRRLCPRGPPGASPHSRNMAAGPGPAPAPPQGTAGSGEGPRPAPPKGSGRRGVGRGSPGAPVGAGTGSI